jgi:hypothetical protein
MQHVIRAGVAGLLSCLALAASASAGPQVSVRVEGQSSTLLGRTAVTLPDGTEPNTGCPGDSAAAAIETATAGNWDRQPFTQTILGETHDFSNSDYWGFWVFRGGVFKSTTGICDERVGPGEELLAGYQVSDASFAPTVFPLWLGDVPATVAPGVPFTVTVNRAACETTFCNPGEGHAEPAAGATVTAGGRSATADAQGRATLTLAAGGPADLQATLAGALPTAIERTCVTDGADAFCGSDYQIPVPADRTPPRSRVKGIRDGRRFEKGPRALRAAITDASALASVRLALTRRAGRRCSAFKGDSERFTRVKCGRHPQFGVGTSKTISFLLPSRLPRGRYVFDVVAIDVEGNRERITKGRNRVRFSVA